MQLELNWVQILKFDLNTLNVNFIELNWIEFKSNQIKIPIQKVLKIC